jgi:SAM-dependent methyltransferase
MYGIAGWGIYTHTIILKGLQMSSHGKTSESDMSRYIKPRWRPEYYQQPREPKPERKGPKSNAAPMAKMQVLDRIAMTIPRIKTLLDVGCGTGVDTPEITKMHIEYTGAEPVEFKYQQAAGNYPLQRFVQCFAHDMPFKDGEFDCVMALGVMECIETDYVIAAWEECLRVCAHKLLVLDTTRQPVLMAERYAAIPQHDDVTIYRASYDQYNDKAFIIWEVTKQ